MSYGHVGQCPVNVGHALHLPLSLIDVCRDCGKERSHVLAGLLDFALHLDKHLSAIIVKHGKATYGILWAIVFAETGLVLTPFLPGHPQPFLATAILPWCLLSGLKNQRHNLPDQEAQIWLTILSIFGVQGTPFCLPLGHLQHWGPSIWEQCAPSLLVRQSLVMLSITPLETTLVGPLVLHLPAHHAL